MKIAGYGVAVIVAASMFEKTLLTEICKPETRDALKYEGQQTLETSFGVLGQVAMRELFSDLGVAKELERFASFIDQRKIEKLVAPAP